jgi:hypothetical protein
VGERKPLAYDPSQRLRTSDHQLFLIRPSSQMDHMHRRNSQNSPSWFLLQHILQQVIFLTTKTYITYICIVHTTVLFQSSVGVYHQTQHIKYCYEHTTSVTFFSLHCSHLQDLQKRSNEHWLLHLYVGDTLFRSVIKIIIISCS